ncbi:MAG: hypothetical protein KAR44_11735, partial [Candidatus Aegiribacteria sp.]|nr:hypothetical protein [Candidatus Aegiribacteria sp.]
MNNLSAYMIILLLFAAGAALADNVDPPQSAVTEAVIELEVCRAVNLEASDTPEDAGGSVSLTWLVETARTMPDSLGVMRSDPSGGEELITTLPVNILMYNDQSVSNGIEYSYWIVSYLGGYVEASSEMAVAVPSAQWIYKGRIGMLIILALITGVIFYYIEAGKRGKELYIREIAGLEAVDEAVGRATEMGRPVLYIPGIMDMDNIQTIASIVILGRVARKTAEYGSPLLVPTCRSVVMSVAQEVVKEGYLQAGRADAFNKENIQYLTDDQFGYAAG